MMAYGRYCDRVRVYVSRYVAVGISNIDIIGMAKRVAWQQACAAAKAWRRHYRAP